MFKNDTLYKFQALRYKVFKVEVLVHFLDFKKHYKEGKPRIEIKKKNNDELVL